MRIAQKVDLYRRVATDTESLAFGRQNLILFDVAVSLGLRHFFDGCCYELRHARRRAPLAVIIYRTLTEREARSLA